MTHPLDNPAILYITYDGLLDPLGCSQILPYLSNLSKHYPIHILSFEKPAKFSIYSQEKFVELSRFNIRWHPLVFTTRAGFLGKLWDLLKMYLFSLLITIQYNPQLIHCRTHAPAQVGSLIKLLFKKKFLFDFRGLWADERIDKGGWNLSNPFHHLQYRFYKYLEKILLLHSDHVVVLTDRVKAELCNLYPSLDAITVIPCCADYHHFQLATPRITCISRSSLGIPSNAFVIGYLGSIGGMYMYADYLNFLNIAIKTNPSVMGLILTPDLKKAESGMSTYLDIAHRDKIYLRSASRKEVAEWLPSMDILTSFITSTYARMGSSPTKLAESWACGIPTISSPMVGDVDHYIHLLDAGGILNLSDPKEVYSHALHLSELKAKGGARLRNASRQIFDLQVGSSSYLSIYNNLL